MVYIKHIEIRGFKTFGNKKVTIPLDRGFTVITGPNGSGKSNILDAVRFVLGDLSTRSLRTDKMSDVIFDGGQSGSSGAAKMAYVNIQLDNSDRQIPIDTDAVTISRRVDRTGASEYFLNGKQAPRSQLVDILSIANLSPSGYNIIMQGTITRLADVTPEERRKLIEGLIGIAEYDAKKAEAQIQLQQAETNFRIASARIGDVQIRLESLEEERNDALRYNFIQKEIRQFQAILCSYKLSYLDAERTEFLARLQQRSYAVEDLKKQQNQLQFERDNVESARRKFDEEVADKGNIRLVNIQKTLGDIMANVAKLRMEIEAGTISLRGLTRIREERLQHFETLKNAIRDTRKNLSELMAERDKVKQSLDEKNVKHQEVSTRLMETKKSFGANTEKLKEVEDALNKLSRQMLKLNTRSNAMTFRHRIVADNLKILGDRRMNFELTLTDLQKHFAELQRLQKGEQDSLIKVSDALTSNIKRKDIIISEMNDAEKTAKMAGNAVVEFEVQKSFAERMGSDDNALQRIEEMGETGAISGILGRLENLIKVNPRYQRAIDVASSGWLKAVIVRDVEVALKCVESLKKMKLGRIKLIPLKEVEDIAAVAPPNIGGVIGPASGFVRCSDRYVPAVNFVFGDTIVTSGEKSAFLASKAGYRAIDVNGDLYEAGGGIESGYYRSPIEISSLIASEKAIEGLAKSVQSLEAVLSKRKGDISMTDAEISRLNEEQIRQSDSISTIGRDLGLINQNIERAKQNVNVLNEKMSSFQKYLEKGNELQSQMQLERDNYRKHLLDLLPQQKTAKLQVKPAVMARYETDQSQLNIEFNELNRQFVKVESDVRLLETNLEATLQPELERTKIDLRNLDRQISTLQEKTSQAQLSLDEANIQLSELERSKESLSTALASVKDRRKEFEEQLDKMDWQLRKLDHEYDPLTNEIHRLELELQTKNLDINRLKEELHSLGYDAPIIVILDEVKSAESSLNLLRFEFEKLGSVNQLAIAQYDEQQANYKQLSVRLNQLESERKSIIDFMEEIERKKRNAFMQAYDKINEDFAKFFSKLTGGGEGYLSLQDKEDLFAAGIDIFVQFPGKISRLIAAASGGEKSITAVSFIFAIQNLSPAPFYMFDEIDAHLDPFNSERLADLLKNQSVTSQFIVVTLRDVIIDRSDRLFGVYIQDGSSKIVSTKLAEVVA